MPFMNVLFSGTGVLVPHEDSDDPIIGFYTTRRVWATSAASAEAEAKQLVLEEWTSGHYAQSNKGAVPVLKVESIRHVGLLRGFFSRRPAGYTFYCRE